MSGMGIDSEQKLSEALSGQPEKISHAWGTIKHLLGSFTSAHRNARQLQALGRANNLKVSDLCPEHKKKILEASAEIKDQAGGHTPLPCSGREPNQKGHVLVTSISPRSVSTHEVPKTQRHEHQKGSHSLCPECEGFNITANLTRWFFRRRITLPDTDRLSIHAGDILSRDRLFIKMARQGEPILLAFKRRLSELVD